MDNKRGKCINFGNDCSVADRLQIVELGVTEDFVCPECGNDLIEDVKPPPPIWPKILIGVALLAGIGFGVYWLITRPKAEKPEIVKGTGTETKGEEVIVEVSISLNKRTISLREGRSETLTATVLPENVANKDVEWTSSDASIARVNNGSVTAVKAGKATITATSKADPTKSAVCEVTVTVPSETTQCPAQPCPSEAETISFSVGRYTGPKSWSSSLCKCIPNGESRGRMEYTRTTQLSLQGGGTIVAEEGWSLTGVWRNGNVVNGRLSDKDGNQVGGALINTVNHPLD